MLSEALQIEKVCFKEFLLLVKRDIRYFYFVLCLYLRSVNTYKDVRLLRATYCLARYIDDIIDGDRKCCSDPEKLINNLRLQIYTENFCSDNHIAILAEFILRELDREYESKEVVKKALLNMIDLIVFDYRRTHEKIISSEEELDRRLFKVLFSAVDISLIIMRAKIRAEDISDLIYAQVHIYTVRDIEKDFNRGLINIPYNLLMEAGYNNGEFSFNDLIKSHSYREWIKCKFERGESYLQSASEKIKPIDDPRAKMVLNPILKGLKLNVLRYGRKMRSGQL